MKQQKRHPPSTGGAVGFVAGMVSWSTRLTYTQVGWWLGIATALFWMALHAPLDFANGALRGLRAVFDALRGYLSEGERLTAARRGGRGDGVPVSRAAVGRKKVS
ncbi:hypothetical protein Rsub_01613 [Raphidocelis subcapitata]|uniref:Uncharacterized protein n=1 Tax=Raphidocelis subcapitata TaxID=307507 RepID=A0A2V0NMJ0_9CHLO|nr:hypothetical protein Rsub_01613 [Raphidocelis subcapitata]|eukprot:GBF88714.1 hypothetical protein Rsub_01613 [Raphidocelis subcapitata]